MTSRVTAIGVILRLLNIFDAACTYYEGYEANPVLRPMFEYSPILFVFFKIVCVGLIVSAIERLGGKFISWLVIPCVLYTMMAVVHVVLITHR